MKETNIKPLDAAITTNPLIFEVGTIADLLIVDAQIAEFNGTTTAQTIKSRIGDNVALILIAKADGVPVAYKLGYQLSNEEFYSWLGAVTPAYRKQGVATKLRELQESWAINAGYTRISVKSMNHFPAMLQLLISSGYQINGYENNGNSSTSKICFVKELV